MSWRDEKQAEDEAKAKNRAVRKAMMAREKEGWEIREKTREIVERQQRLMEQEEAQQGAQIGTDVERALIELGYTWSTIKG